MKVQQTSEICVMGLLDVMPGDYSLGVPVEDGAIQVGTANKAALGNIHRLRVSGTEPEVEIEMEDSEPLQAVAYDYRLKGQELFSLNPSVS